MHAAAVRVAKTGGACAHAQVRSFTVLDGIGKSLDPRFDISEIAAPYARSLLLEAKPQFAKLQDEFGKRLQKQARALTRPPALFMGCWLSWCP